MGENMEKILIVDDNPTNITILSEIFRIEYKIFVANNGEKAISIAERVKPDLILLDVMMPEMDGYEVCKSLRNKSDTADIPIIFITAKTSSDDIIYGFNMGAQDYIAKPFNQGEMIVRVKNQIELKKMREKIKQTAEEIENSNIETKAKNFELEKMIFELNKTREKLIASEKLATIGRMTGGIAHEINSPLSGVITSFEMLKFDIDDLSPANIEQGKKEIYESLDVIKKGITKIRNIISSISKFSDKYGDENIKIVLNEAFDVILKSLGEKLKKEKILIKSEIEKNKYINLNGNEFEIIVLNVLNNSIDALRKVSERERTIDIRAFEEEKHTILEFIDNGCGIPDNVAPKIFDPFFTTKDVGEGLGLGLSIVYDIVIKYGGEIFVDSVENEYTVITIKVPIE